MVPASGFGPIERSGKYSLPASREALAAVSYIVREECRRHSVASEDMLAIELICDELVANIWRHAYGEGLGEFEFSIGFDADACTLQFVDSGPPFDPTLRESPNTEASIEERPIGGLGILFVLRQADRVEYERRDDHNVVTVVKALERPPPANGA